MIFGLIVLASSKVTLQGLFAKKHISTISDSIRFNGIIFFFSMLIFVYALHCPLPVIGFGAFFGVLTVLFQLCYIQAMSYGNVSLTVLIVNSSMILPILISAILFHETFDRIRILGILTVMLSLCLNVEPKQKEGKDGCFADTATIGFLIRGGGTIITNSGFFSNKLMGLRNSLAIKNDAEGLVVTNSFFANPTGTERFYEGDRNAVTWNNNSVEENKVFGAYFANGN